MRPRLPALFASTAVLTLLAAGCGDDVPSGPDAGGTPTSTSSPSPSASESASGSPTDAVPADGPRLTSRGLPQGTPPALAYIAADDPADPFGAWSLVRPDGQELAIPHAGPRTFALVGDGLVLVGPDGETTSVSVVDGNGKEVRREEARGYNLAVSDDGSLVAWLGADGRTTVLEDGGDRTVQLQPVDQADDIAAILGTNTCKDEGTQLRCLAYLNAGRSQTTYWVDAHGQTLQAGSMLSISDATDGGRVAGLVSVTDEGSCSGVYGKAKKPVWQTCDFTLTRFSPDGTRILGTDAYLDGFGQRTVAFLDGGGALLHRFASRGRGATVLQTAWEDADHVLAVLYERGQWSIVRLGVDGSAELAVAPVSGSDLDRPFALEQA